MSQNTKKYKIYLRICYFYTNCWYYINYIVKHNIWYIIIIKSNGEIVTNKTMKTRSNDEVKLDGFGNKRI